MNIQPGAYRAPLVAGLVAIGEDELAHQIANKNLKLAVGRSIKGAVISRTDLKQKLIDALRTESANNDADEGVCDHYIRKLIEGSVVPVENNPMVQSDRHYAPGELFFKS